MSSPIESLVECARHGDRAARHELVERYQPLLWRIVLRYRSLAVGSGVEIEDLYQQAVQLFLELIDVYQPERSNGFGPYVKKMLDWRVYNSLRAHRRRQPIHHGYGAAIPPEIAQRCVTHDTVNWGVYEVSNDRLRRALGRLSAKQKRILARLYGDGCPTGEVAVQLGISIRAVTRLRQRALLRLRAELNAPASAGAAYCQDQKASVPRPTTRGGSRPATSSR